jgi:hypothetical protein
MSQKKHPQSKISNPQSKIGSQDANITRKLKFSRLRLTDKVSPGELITYIFPSVK